MQSKAAKMVTENIPFLRGEILCMILGWLEAKCLLRCTSVCKVWNAVIIEDIQFVDMHAIQNGCRSDHIISHKRLQLPGRRTDTAAAADDVDVNLDTSAKEQKKYKYLSFISCRGLLVEGYISRSWIRPEKIIPHRKCYNKPTRKYSTLPATKYQIRNFTTKRVVDLPRPHKGVIIMRVFFNSSTSSYHVVSLYNDDIENKVKFQVIDLGGHSNDPCPNYKDHLSWRTLNIPEYDAANKQQEYDCMSCVLEESILFIPTLRKVVSTDLPMIVCVDLVQQACITLDAPPESLRFEDRKVNFQLWRGKPALSLVTEDQNVLYVWIVEDYKEQKWDDPILIPLPFLNENPPLKTQIPQIYQGDDEEDFLVYKREIFDMRTVIGYHVLKHIFVMDVAPN